MKVFRTSIIIENAEEWPIAMVEVKALSGLTLEVAMHIRSSMLERGLPSQIPYFLLVSQDRGFLWKGNKRVDENTLPDCEFPMDSVIARYAKVGPEKRLWPEVLEIYIMRWLTDLSLTSTLGISDSLDMKAESEKALAQAGFIDWIQDSMILAGAVA